ncbi:MAG: rhomboid family intramembrane serine protease, partial [Pyrobaculum sp.]
MAARYDIAIWAGFQFLLPLLEPSVAVFAHTGGLIAGVALAPLFAKRENVERLREDIREGKFRGLQPEGDEVIIKGWDGVVKAVLAAVVFVVLIIAILGVKSHTWQVYSVKFKSSGYVEEAVKPGPPRPMTVEKVVVYSESCYPMTQLPTCTFQNGQVYCSSIIIPGCPVVDRYILVRHGPATNAGVVASIAALAAISLQLARAVRTQREWEIL